MVWWLLMKISFEEERKKEENQNILSFLNKINDMTSQEIEQLKLIVLWESVSTFDKNKGCKFTTHLYNTCRFAFLKHINKKRDVFVEQFETEYSYTTTILDDLPTIYKTILEDRYIYRYSLREIGEKHNIKLNQVKSLIEDSKNCLKESLTT